MGPWALPVYPLLALRRANRSYSLFGHPQLCGVYDWRCLQPDALRRSWSVLIPSRLAKGGPFSSLNQKSHAAYNSCLFTL